MTHWSVIGFYNMLPAQLVHECSGVLSYHLQDYAYV